MTALRRPLIAFSVLAAGFIALSAAVTTGLLRASDRSLEAAILQIDRPAWVVVAQGFAVLGGVEITTLMIVATAVWMWRSRLLPEAWGLLAFPIAVVVEVFYKRLINQPPPSPAHLDGPTLLQLLGGINRAANSGGSFPSGHMTRAVVAYGIVAFIVARFADRRAVRWVAVVGSAVLCLAVAVTRVYLSVHWESDVLGGLLLGGLALIAAVIWMDRPL